MQSNDGLVLCVGPEGNAGAESGGVSEMLAFNLVSKPQAGAGFLYSYFGLAILGADGPRIGPVGLCSKSGADKEAPCPQELSKGPSGSAAPVGDLFRLLQLKSNCDLVLYLASLTRTVAKAGCFAPFL